MDNKFIYSIHGNEPYNLSERKISSEYDGKNKREAFYGSPFSFEPESNTGLSMSPTLETIGADIKTFHKHHKKQLLKENQQKIHAELIQRDIRTRKKNWNDNARNIMKQRSHLMIGSA